MVLDPITASLKRGHLLSYNFDGSVIYCRMMTVRKMQRCTTADWMLLQL
jgi:hypothetical protein